jgi:signal transduction histidine kinase
MTWADCLIIHGSSLIERFPASTERACATMRMGVQGGRVHRRHGWAWLLAGAAVVAGAAELHVGARYGDVRAVKYVSDVLFAVTWVVRGIVASHLRPNSRIGPLMVLLGLVTLLNNPWGFALPTVSPLRRLITVLGVAGFWVSVALGGHLLLGYPAGRLRNRTERLLVGTGYVSAGVFTTAQLLVLSPDPAVCGSRCPVSPVQLIDNSALSSGVFRLAAAWFAVLAVACLAVLVRRYVTATPRHRRREGVPLIAAALVVLAMGVWFVGSAVAGTWPDVTVWLIYPAIYLSLGAVPVALLVGLLRERLLTAGVTDIVIQLEDVGPDRLEPAMQAALDDPNLQIGFPVGDAGDLVDTRGAWLTVPSGRATTPLGEVSAPTAVLIHDPDLHEHPELLRAAGAAARLALENARLHAEVRAQLAEVQASRQRLVAAADSERRRLERNLHDGAQQRLLGIGMTLQALRAQLTVHNGSVELLDSTEQELKAALRELRDLAQGLHPAVLTDQGLVAAVGLAARRCNVPVAIDNDIDQRLPEPVETTAYYVISEALQNISKHSHATQAEVHISKDEDGAVITVTDNGDGGANTNQGTGLRGMADRAAAANGTLKVSSQPGAGTTVLLRLPCA